MQDLGDKCSKLEQTVDSNRTQFREEQQRTQHFKTSTDRQFLDSKDTQGLLAKRCNENVSFRAFEMSQQDEAAAPACNCCGWYHLVLMPLRLCKSQHHRL